MRPHSTHLCGLLIVVTLAFCVTRGTQAATVFSDFDDGTLQGWMKGPGFNGQLFVDPGVGNPGGSMAFTDTAPAGGGLYAKAPSAFAGDFSGLAGIAWDRFVPNYGANTKNAGGVVLVGGPNSTAFWHLPLLNDLGSWAHKFVPFENALWQPISIGQLGATGTDAFQAVVDDVHTVYMAGDTSNLASGTLEIRIDNIALIPVPEPATGVGLTIGLLVTCMSRRRRRP